MTEPEASPFSTDTERMSGAGFVKSKDNASVMWRSQRRLSRASSGLYGDGGQTEGQTRRLLCSSMWHLVDTDCSGKITAAHVDLLDRLAHIATDGALPGVAANGEGHRSTVAALLDDTKRSQGGIRMSTYLDTVHARTSGSGNAQLAERLVAEVDAISDAWYTGNKWPRGRVAYTKLFLPVVHLVIAICFTAEHLFGQLSLVGLQSAAAAAVTAASAPLRRVIGTSAVQALVNLAAFRLPDVLQEYTFYFAFVPVFSMMVVRSALSRSPALHPVCATLSKHHSAILTVSDVGTSADVACAAQGTLLSWAKEVEPQANSVHSIIQGVTEGANADALRFFDLDKSYVIRLLRPVLRMRKPWQFAALGLPFCMAMMLSTIDTRVAATVRHLGGFSRNVSDTDGDLASVCRAQELQIGLALVQYWAYAIVFLLGSINTACSLTPAFRRAWDMDMASLAGFKFDNGSENAEPVTAAQVYRWLLRAKVPLEFAIGNVFWDGVKRFLFTPCCLFYGVLPVAAAGWAASSCSAAPMLHQLLLSALLVVPNIATAFVFQSFMISVAATVRRKLHAMKALSHMLSPLGSLVVGLPTVTLQRPQTLVAWLRLRTFAQSSFEFPEMIRVEAGFTAIVLLVIVLQVLLLSLVTTQHWAHAAIVLYYYWLCIVYGFGTVIVAMDASREFESHTRALNELRLTFVTSCYLGWSASHGSATERRDAKDVCFQVKEVVEWTKQQDARHRSGVLITRAMVIAMRAFMLAMLATTASRLPSVVTLGRWVTQQPAFHDLKRLHGLLGPLLGILGIV